MIQNTNKTETLFVTYFVPSIVELDSRENSERGDSHFMDPSMSPVGSGRLTTVQRRSQWPTIFYRVLYGAVV
jgi:hypothetical protein